MLHVQAGLHHPMGLQNDGVQHDVAQETDQRLMVLLPVAMETKLSAVRVGVALTTEVHCQPFYGFFHLSAKIIYSVMQRKCFNDDWFPSKYMSDAPT